LSVALLVAYWLGLEGWREAESALNASLDSSHAVLELKFRIADMNGWQTASALEFERGKWHADESPSRKHFVESARAFDEQLKRVEQFLFDPEERRILKRLSDSYAQFMSTDAEIIKGFRSGDPARIIEAHEKVLGFEVETFKYIAALADALVRAVQSRTDHHLSHQERTSAAIRNLLLVGGGIGFLLSMLLTALLFKAFDRNRTLITELSLQAHTDALTGLANRRTWDVRLHVELARAKRLGYPLTLTILDLDHFKKFNDQYGHAQGDELLKQAAQVWQLTLREGDLIARIGGEEFGVLMPGCTVESAALTIERLRARMPMSQTFSAGIAGYVLGETAQQLMLRADRALYRAKFEGRDQAIIAEVVDEKLGAPSRARA
jgi:diguanylate cyclase (GGDEF)-like protein